MQPSSTSKTTLLVAAIVEIILLPSFFYILPINSIQNGSSPFIRNVFALQKEQTNPEVPVRIKIQKIKVDAPIDSVGLTSNGAVGVPKNPTHAAWFNKSPSPGNVGSAVITGHIGPWGGGLKPAFDNLKKLKKGDAILVKNKKGVMTTFIVNKIKVYNENDDVPEAFFSSDGKAHLNLITCAGTWNRISKSYSKRLIVFTDKGEPKTSSLW
ncbi:MAG: class F sortase [Candidatus Uhrbacteria bacterium]|nr:class F sortase [Candidatus Uhrbacteria bacterium]